MVVGMVPLLIAHGAGAKSRFDIGLVIAAGMTVGTMFTLFITPAVYTFVARDRRRMTARAGRTAAPGSAERAPARQAELPEAA
jgi:multidrug efflux pump